ncbi:MAG: CotH kinase family protein [Candidatus Omnitrophica bacterium]|nr:CotH kinase family protein [Candidatus Omnitrophota bacterium]
MIIKRAPKGSQVKTFFPRRINHKALLVSGVIMFSLFMFAVGVFAHKSGLTYRLMSGPGKWLNIPYSVNCLTKYLKGQISRPETISIDIKFKDYQKLQQKREQAITNRFLNASPEDYVPADIHYKDKIVPVSLRLKGDGSDHWTGEAWSFRIEVKGDEALFGMKKFSIQNPATRNGLHEWVFKKIIGREDMIALGYDFINVIVNGKDKGIYAIEEYPLKQVVERNNRREGVIIKFNDELHFQEWVANPYEYAPIEETIRAYHASNIDTFGIKKILKNPVLQEQYYNAVTLLALFRTQKLEASKVFDVDKIAKFYALSDLFGALHGGGWGNLRFYYNPITSKLEPVAYDNMPGEEKFFLSCNLPPFLYGVCYYTGDESQLINNLFDDHAFFERYLYHLERISQNGYLENFMESINNELTEKLHIIYRSNPEYNFNSNVYYRNRDYIRQFLNPIKAFHAYYLKNTEESLELRLGNVQTLPVEIVSVIGDKYVFYPGKQIELKPWKYATPVNYQNYSFYSKDKVKWTDDMASNLFVNYRILGTSSIKRVKVFPWKDVKPNFIKEDLVRQEPNVQQFDFISIDEEKKSILVKPGKWMIDKNLIIPEGYQFMISPGTEIDLINSSKILSYSALKLIGSESDPIIIRSSDNTGQGIAVLAVKSRSYIEHARFEGLLSPKQFGWELTGGVTFYESPVDIKYSQFLNCRSEDGLNIVRSEFLIDGCLFKKLSSDAFDVDFCTGKIINTSFVNCRNDAIDISGSIVEVRDIFINEVKDKGISVHENGKVTGNNLVINDAHVGAVSKDLSKLELDKVVISDCRVALAAYQKKAEFGPATIVIKELKMKAVKTPYLIEKGSELTIGKKKIAGEESGLKDILY